MLHSNDLLAAFAKTQAENAAAHASYLRQAQEALAQAAQVLAMPWPEGATAVAPTGAAPAAAGVDHPRRALRPTRPPLNPEKAWLDYAQCHEYAVGSVGKVLGSEFAAADQFPTRVRLPDGPLLLCHRIMSVEAVPKSMSSGVLVTEHDVLPDAWYLDDGRIPVCVAVEAGQADLFLSGYLGADFHTRGLAVYRLLDAVVTFHDRLPEPGTVIRYVIKIHQFFRQGETLLFRFSFDALANGRKLMTMANGCAGFFTAGELAAGRGVVKTALDRAPRAGKAAGGYAPLAPLPLAKEEYDEIALDALRRGAYAECFGAGFGGLELARPKRLPGGADAPMLRLVHRILELEPRGGRFGSGRILGEADIRPDDWFLTCHFVDDMVMPGTLMYYACSTRT
jgi:3-hydroxymyristoyl/3-hydroxydecanoyl-(acyl carrier protein) dehydratase